ncbi:MAG: hypothetical protein JWQ04_2009 [Pedosphaera sp.]|nr:hypothetical protein [Pedosphaera sp.]
MEPLWRVELGYNILLGVTSSLVALPLFEADMLAEERAEWHELREAQLAGIRDALTSLKPRQRVLFFCHDPSALPFLWRDETVRACLPRIELTIIGHLHSNLVFRNSRLLSGMPPVGFLGHTVKRMSTALSEGRHWRPFKVRLCPSLAGIELLKDGGYCTVDVDEDAREKMRFQFHRMKR